MHRLVLVQMRQDDAVEAPVGAEVEQHELAVGLSLGQRRLNVLVGVRAVVIRALCARRGVRTNGECQEGGQREGLHTGLHGPTGISEVYTARALQGFSIYPRIRVLPSRARGPWGSRSGRPSRARASRSEEHTSELQSRLHLVCRL